MEGMQRNINGRNIKAKATCPAFQVLDLKQMFAVREGESLGEERTINQEAYGRAKKGAQ